MPSALVMLPKIGLCDDVTVSAYSCLGLLWTAPEILADTAKYSKGTREGDVYAFGIILHEIFFRMGPFSGHPYLTPEGKVEGAIMHVQTTMITLLKIL